jgi:hypothetical protein
MIKSGTRCYLQLSDIPALPSGCSVKDHVDKIYDYLLIELDALLKSTKKEDVWIKKRLSKYELVYEYSVYSYGFNSDVLFDESPSEETNKKLINILASCFAINHTKQYRGTHRTFVGEGAEAFFDDRHKFSQSVDEAQELLMHYSVTIVKPLKICDLILKIYLESGNTKYIDSTVLTFSYLYKSALDMSYKVLLGKIAYEDSYGHLEYKDDSSSNFTDRKEIANLLLDSSILSSASIMTVSISPFSQYGYLITKLLEIDEETSTKLLSTFLCMPRHISGGFGYPHRYGRDSLKKGVTTFPADGEVIAKNLKLKKKRLSQGLVNNLRECLSYINKRKYLNFIVYPYVYDTKNRVHNEAKSAAHDLTCPSVFEEQLTREEVLLDQKDRVFNISSIMEGYKSLIENLDRIKKYQS